MGLQEPLSVASGALPQACFFLVRRIDRSSQPASQREVACVYRQLVATAIVERGQMIVLVQPVEYGIALVDLAFADQPEFLRTCDDPLASVVGEFGAKGQAIEDRDVHALVIRFVNVEVPRQVTAAHQFQRVAVAELPRGLEQSVFIQECLDGVRCRVAQIGAKPRTAQVGPEDVLFQQLLFVRVERLDGAPVTAIDVGKYVSEEFALRIDVGGKGRNANGRA